MAKGSLQGGLTENVACRHLFTEVNSRTFRVLSHCLEPLHAIIKLNSICPDTALNSKYIKHDEMHFSGESTFYIWIFKSLYYCFFLFQLLFVEKVKQNSFLRSFHPSHPFYYMSFFSSLMILFFIQLHLLLIRFLTLHRSFQQCRIIGGMNDNIIIFSEINLSEDSVLFFNKHCR